VHYLVSAKDLNGPDLDLDKIIGDLDTTEVVLRVSMCICFVVLSIWFVWIITS